MAPTLYAWVRFSGRIWPRRDLRTAMTKALVEQVTYGPFASATFFFAMTYMETKNTALARKEVADKFLPTYKVYTWCARVCCLFWAYECLILGWNVLLANFVDD